MKYLVLIAMIVLTTAEPLDYKRYENFNVDEVLSNDRLLAGLMKCFLNTGPCTPENADMKKIIPDALKSSCGECSLKQKALVARVIETVIEKRPEDWKQLNKLHNPEGKYDERIKMFVEEYANKKY